MSSKHQDTLARLRDQVSAWRQQCERADARADAAEALLRDLTDCRDFGEFLNEHLPRVEVHLFGKVRG